MPKSPMASVSPNPKYSTRSDMLSLILLSTPTPYTNAVSVSDTLALNAPAPGTKTLACPSALMTLRPAVAQTKRLGCTRTPKRPRMVASQSMEALAWAVAQPNDGSQADALALTPMSDADISASRP